VVRPVIKETTALGAAYAAGLAVGYFSDLADLKAKWAADYTWTPNMDASTRDTYFRAWKKAVTRSFDWVEE
jgi:glycerol kinase